MGEHLGRTPLERHLVQRSFDRNVNSLFVAKAGETKVADLGEEAVGLLLHQDVAACHVPEKESEEEEEEEREKESQREYKNNVIRINN